MYYATITLVNSLGNIFLITLLKCNVFKEREESMKTSKVVAVLLSIACSMFVVEEVIGVPQTQKPSTSSTSVVCYPVVKQKVAQKKKKPKQVKKQQKKRSPALERIVEHPSEKKPVDTNMILVGAVKDCEARKGVIKVVDGRLICAPIPISIVEPIPLPSVQVMDPSSETDSFYYHVSAPSQSSGEVVLGQEVKTSDGVNPWIVGGTAAGLAGIWYLLNKSKPQGSWQPSTAPQGGVLVGTPTNPVAGGATNPLP